MLNFLTKIIFTSYTLTLSIAKVININLFDSEDTWHFILLILVTRFITIAEVTTFFFMSFSKMLLFWRPELYVRLNSSRTVNLSTILVIGLFIMDFSIRVNLHVFHHCPDNQISKVTHFEFDTSLKTFNDFDETEPIESNQTATSFPKVSTSFLNATDDNKSLGSYDGKETQVDEICSWFPILRILFGSVFLCEAIKFGLTMFYMAKKYLSNIKRKTTLQKAKNHSDQKMKTDGVVAKETNDEDDTTAKNTNLTLTEVTTEAEIGQQEINNQCCKKSKINLYIKKETCHVIKVKPYESEETHIECNDLTKAKKLSLPSIESDVEAVTR